MKKARPFPSRQLQVLLALMQVDNQSAADVATATACTREAARDCLERLRSYGAVSRVPGAGERTYYYRISKKGRKRLSFLQLRQAGEV